MTPTTAGCTRSGRRGRRPCPAGPAATVPAGVEVTSVHTLGPEGTNCELAARQWFARAGRAGTVVLHGTLEAAAGAALATEGAALLVPAAYPEFHTLVYSHVDELVLADTIVMPTHAMVLARRPGCDAVATVATHPAPVALVAGGAAVRLVSSNAQAAADCAAGLADACITTSAARERYGLELMRDFGPVQMAFTVHVARHGRAGRGAGEYDRPGTSDD